MACRHVREPGRDRTCQGRGDGPLRAQRCCVRLVAVPFPDPERETPCIAARLTSLVSNSPTSTAAITGFDRLIDTVTSSLQTPAGPTVEPLATDPPVDLASLWSQLAADQDPQAAQQAAPPTGIHRRRERARPAPGLRRRVRRADRSLDRRRPRLELPFLQGATTNPEDISTRRPRPCTTGATPGWSFTSTASGGPHQKDHLLHRHPDRCHPQRQTEAVGQKNRPGNGSHTCVASQRGRCELKTFDTRQLRTGVDQRRSAGRIFNRKLRYIAADVALAGVLPRPLSN